MAKGAKPPSDFAEISGEPIPSVSRYLVLLQENDVITKVEKATYILVDKLFSFWLKKRYE